MQNVPLNFLLCTIAFLIQNLKKEYLKKIELLINFLMRNKNPKHEIFFY